MATSVSHLIRDVDEFGVEITFERDTPTPSRIFRGMSAYIESFELIDSALLASLTTRIKPTLLLEDIEAGSIRAWLKNTLEAVDDEALKSGDYKKLIGAYLVRGKRAMIDFIDKRTTIESADDITNLQHNLLVMAQETDALRIPTFRPVGSAELAESLRMLGESSNVLLSSDTAKYLNAGEETTINVSFSVSPQQIDELIVKEQLSSDAPMIIRVKKPDFLGDSMWDFVYSGQTKPMRMVDADWVQRFRRGELPLLPGDSLRALVKTTVKYGFDNEVVGTQYEVIKVLDVLPYRTPQQGRFLQQ